MAVSKSTGHDGRWHRDDCLHAALAMLIRAQLPLTRPEHAKALCLILFDLGGHPGWHPGRTYAITEICFRAWGSVGHLYRLRRWQQNDFHSADLPLANSNEVGRDDYVARRRNSRYGL